MALQTFESSAPDKRNRLLLVYICAVAAIGGFLFGLDAIVISGTISRINVQFSLSPAQEGFFVSASLIGCAFGALSASVFADALGRKTSMLLAAALTLVGIVACTVANSLFALIASRLCGGLGIGLASMFCPLYMAEMSPGDVRGRMVSLYQLAITAGIVVALAINTSVEAGFLHSLTFSLFHGDTWRTMFATQMLPACLFAALTLGLPESPRWLVGRDRAADARAFLVKVASHDEAELLLNAAPATGSIISRQIALFGRSYRRPLAIRLWSR